jgi:hypothetical protein
MWRASLDAMGSRNSREDAGGTWNRRGSTKPELRVRTVGERILARATALLGRVANPTMGAHLRRQPSG